MRDDMDLHDKAVQIQHIAAEKGKAEAATNEGNRERDEVGVVAYIWWA